MRNYDKWLEQKQNSKNKIILFLSWMFFRTFNNDARFLSDKFWFKIKQTWWYEVVWFPENSLEKYLEQLKQEDYWYLVFEKNWEELEKVKENNWSKKIIFDQDKLIYLDIKKEEQQKDFKSFLKELNILLKNYI